MARSRSRTLSGSSGVREVQLSVPLCLWTCLLCVCMDFITIKIFSKRSVTLVCSQRQVGGACEFQRQEAGAGGRRHPRPLQQGRKTQGGRSPGSWGRCGCGVLCSASFPGGGPVRRHPLPFTCLWETDPAPLAASEPLTISRQPLLPTSTKKKKKKTPGSPDCYTN